MRASLPKKETVHHFARSAYWFAVGFILSAAILSAGVLLYFQFQYKDKVIPGIFVDNVYVGEKTKSQIDKIFSAKNEKIGKNTFVFSADNLYATVSAKTLKMGYDVNLIEDQVLSLGKTKNVLSDIYIVFSSYINGTFLTPPFTVDDDLLKKTVSSIAQQIYRDPVDAEFAVNNNNRVTAFKQSSDGQSLDLDAFDIKVRNEIPNLVNKEPGVLGMNIPIKIVNPKVTTGEANKLGIVEPIGTGTSSFYHSIPGRIHNVALATSRVNGVLVAPNEEFSFDKALGDVSKFTGYEEAYVIQNGKTVLGDGGGVCQVSTTLFRAILKAGLPITERHAHAYRVGYYEQDAPPGMDATTFVPTVDLKFKNDTGHYILIQGQADTTNLTMSFTLFGKSDGRVSQVTKPVISDTSSAPPDLYQDDPTLPVGTVKQVDFAAPGAKSVFSRTVTRNGQVIINDTFVSVYKPWQAIFLRGTKT